jgi:hypothetical protein
VVISAYLNPQHSCIGLWSRSAVNCTQRLPIFYKTQKEGEALLCTLVYIIHHICAGLEPVYQLTERLLNVCAHSGVV